MGTLIDVNESSKRLNLTPQQVRNLCRDKKIKGRKVGYTWVIDEKEIAKYLENNSCGITLDQPIENNCIINNKKPIALSFFSGAMGLDNGLEKAGFNILLASEIDNACRKTILKNKPGIALIGDINNYTSNNIREVAGLGLNDDIDLIVGGPPCQAFSTAGRRKGFGDERGNVFLTFIDRILEINPKIAVIENVRGLLSAPYKGINGGALYHILNKIRSAGYGVSFNLYNAANFGTPQKRERVVIICSRDGKKLPYLTPTHSEVGLYQLPKWKTFREAVNGLENIRHHYIEFPEKRLKYYRLLKEGQNWRDLPYDLQKQALGQSFYAGGGKTGFLRRLAWDEPSPTLVTHPAMPATDLAHPEKDRPLSIEEYKRIQEFPDGDDWKIEGTIIEQYKQIGNAVPVSLGYAIGKLVINYLSNKEIKSYKIFPYSRYANTNEISWEKDFILRNKEMLEKLRLFA